MFKRIFPLALTVLCIPFAVQASETPICVKADKNEIAALFDRWNTTLQTGDARKVADNYSADAVLLPTLSNQPRTDDAGRIDYFEHFLENKPVGAINTRTVQLGCNNATDTGTYTFTFADNSKVEARYTFTYAWVDNQWLITSHHSSKMPEA